MTKTVAYSDPQADSPPASSRCVYSFRLKRPRSCESVESPPEWDVRAGRTLFRFRSYTLIPLVLGLAALYINAAFGTWSVTAWGLGASLLILGEAIRFHIAAHARPGTSGRGTTIRAATLVTDGPYAATRNPLYLANWLQWVGAAAITGVWWAPFVCAAVVAVQYHFVILAEEAFLDREFGPLFRQFCSQTPRFLPRMSLRNFGSGFDFRKALFREHDTIFLVFLAIWMLPAASASLHSAPLWPWVCIGVLAGAGWVTTKIAKKLARSAGKD